MSDLPSQQKALVLESKQGKFVLGDTAVPKPGPGQLLVKIKATALNPIDWKVQKYGIFVDEYPVILGFDFSGEIAAVGQGVTDFKVADRV
jgi:NADPH:quinone reductase-like Zn-dependent oxidoreductase